MSRRLVAIFLMLTLALTGVMASGCGPDSAVSKQPDSAISEQQKRGAHPIVDWHGFLVGGTVNGKWLSAREMAPHVTGGERYRTCVDAERRTVAVGSKPDRNLIVRTRPDTRGVLAVAGDWNPLPRKAVEDTKHRKACADAVRSILKDKDLPKSPVRVVQCLRADLKGDGNPALIIAAASMYPTAYEVGDYSLVALRTVTKGKATVSLVTGDFHVRKSKGDVPLYYRVGGVWDLDGDGILEVVVTCVSPVIESYWTEVYKLEKGQLRLVAGVRPNYDYKVESSRGT